MFETLFAYKAAQMRHREGPLAPERASYLEGLAAQQMAHDTILCRARYSLCVAIELQDWPPDHCFKAEEVEVLASTWAAKRVTSGRASGPRWPRAAFLFAAIDFLGSLGRLGSPPPAPPGGRYHRELADFIATQSEGRWQSEATCQAAAWQISKFLAYLDERAVALRDVTPEDVDSFFQRMAQRWGRASLRTSAKMLRSWFAHCELRNWIRPGLSNAVLLPRIYRHEGLPLGPTWDAVGQMLSETVGDDARSLRDHAIILLVSVYGLRSGEVRRLKLEDIDWKQGQVRIVRSKSGRKECLPLETKVGNAIARYLRDGRPKAETRALFVTLRAPFRPLSASGLYGAVERRLSRVSSHQRGRGPHGLRHACARHLVECGRSLKDVGDHLGHRSPESTRIYAKVDLASLRLVSFEDLGGLA